MGVGALAAGVESPVGPGLQGIEGTLEAETFQGHVVSGSRVQEQGTDEIVGDHVHPQFTFDHGGRETAQDVEREVGLDLPKMEFDWLWKAFNICKAIDYGKMAPEEVGIYEGVAA